MPSCFEYQNLFASVVPYNKFRGFGDIVRDKRRIKVGYVSPYFKQGDNFPFIYGILACHDKDYFEVTAYSLNSEDDAFTKALTPAVEHFESVRDLSTAELARKIHDDEIDILVDLTGHNEESGLPVFAYKPAPIQVSGIGAPSTSGLNTMTYFITDKQTDPPELHDKFFKETYIYMPCQLCYASNSEAPAPVEPPSIEAGYVTFGAFHDYDRTGDDMLEVWREIMKRVPNSRLLIRSRSFKSDSLIDSAYERMKKLGFNMDSVTFLEWNVEYLKDWLKVDIALDIFPRSDAAATFDALFMGVPVVSYYDERRDSRYSLSILQSIGLGDFAVATGDEYVARAVGLAKDKEALKILHQTLRQRVQKSNAVQPRHYTKVLEQCYEHIIRQFDSGTRV